MANAGISEARLRLIKTRQWNLAWGKDYIAAQWATKTEVPGISTPSILHPEKLGSRAFHCISQNETWVAFLALYHPRVWDIHEQRVLFPQPTPHFLQGHQLALGTTWPPFKGTLDVAERLGMLSRHRKCRVHLESGDTAYAPFPYLGDLLCFLNDEEGPYVINLSVKDKYESFRRKGPRPGKPQSSEDSPSVMDRHSLERIYYKDAGIPTHQVIGGAIDLELRTNLSNLFQYHSKPTTIEYNLKVRLWAHFQQCVGTGLITNKIIKDTAIKLQTTSEEIKDILMQGIWNRKVKIDLFRPMLMDRPLRPMIDDPIEIYRDWFSRG